MIQLKRDRHSCRTAPCEAFVAIGRSGLMASRSVEGVVHLDELLPPARGALRGRAHAEKAPGAIRRDPRTLLILDVLTGCQRRREQGPDAFVAIVPVIRIDSWSLYCAPASRSRFSSNASRRDWRVESPPVRSCPTHTSRLAAVPHSTTATCQNRFLVRIAIGRPSGSKTRR